MYMTKNEVKYKYGGKWVYSICSIFGGYDQFLKKYNDC